MNRKNCDKCNRPSYSSKESGEWFCPICGQDLTHYPIFDALTFERIHIMYTPIHKQIAKYRA